MIYGSLERRTGGNLYDRYVVEALVRRGHEVDIVSLPLVSWWRGLLDGLRCGSSRELAEQLRQHDVVLVDELCHPSLLRLSAALGGAGGPRVVVIVHHLRTSEPGTAVERWLCGRVERAFLQAADALVFNSETTRESVEQLLVPRVVPSLVATPGGDRLLPLMQPAERGQDQHVRKSDDLRLLFVGNVIARKGLDVLVRALSEVEGAWTLDIVGSEELAPDYAKSVRGLVRDEGLEASVRWHGAVDDRLLAERFQCADVLVVPSSWEGFGIVYLEAFASGVPVIAGRLGAAGEIVEHDESGWLVEPADVADLVRWLEILLGDRDRVRDASQAARSAYRSFPSWQQTGDRCASFVEQVVAQPSAPKPS